jgi:hypothetical protein
MAGGTPYILHSRPLCRTMYYLAIRQKLRGKRLAGFEKCTTHKLCYTGAVEKAKQNLTLVIEEDLLRAARKVALDQRTSVNQLVREYLAESVEEPSRRLLARARLRKAFETGLVDVGDRTWSRDDLYER